MDEPIKAVELRVIQIRRVLGEIGRLNINDPDLETHFSRIRIKIFGENNK